MAFFRILGYIREFYMEGSSSDLIGDRSLQEAANSLSLIPSREILFAIFQKMSQLHRSLFVITEN